MFIVFNTDTNNKMILSSIFIASIIKNPILKFLSYTNSPNLNKNKIDISLQFLPIEMVIHIASFIDSPIMKLLNKEFYNEITKDEKADKWKQLYINNLKAISDIPPINDSSNWKYECMQFSKRSGMIKKLDGIVKEVWQNYIDYKPTLEYSLCDIFVNYETCKNHILSFKRIPTNEDKYMDLGSLVITNDVLNGEIPIEICNLSNLTYLDVSNNQIKKFPEKIYNLSNLKYLDMNTNLIETIPKNIRFLGDLHFLFLQYNKIKKIPIEISYLVKLKVLNLVNNQLKSIPIELSDLKDIIIIHLYYNNIKVIPKELDSFKEREILNMALPMGPILMFRFVNLAYMMVVYSFIMN